MIDSGWVGTSSGKGGYTRAAMLTTWAHREGNEKRVLLLPLIVKMLAYLSSSGEREKVIMIILLSLAIAPIWALLGTGFFESGYLTYDDRNGAPHGFPSAFHDASNSL